MSKVLIVDDEPQYGVFLRDWLTREGHEVRTATTAQAAVDFGTSWSPTVLIADWMLKSPLDGLQVSEAVRAVNPELRTILITGYPSPELKARAEKANVFTFIEKPFSLTEVAGAVRQATNTTPPNLPGSILVVSPSPTIAKLAQDTLRMAQHTSYVAHSAHDAKQVLSAEPAISIVILDCVSASIDQGILAEELRALRQEIIVIGSSESDDQQRFAALGVDYFMPRFWDSTGLHDLLIQRVGQCPACGLELPLRRPLPGDQAEDWSCAHCGGRFRAVLLSNASEEEKRRVHKI